VCARCSMVAEETLAGNGVRLVPKPLRTNETTSIMGPLEGSRFQAARRVLGLKGVRLVTKLMTTNEMTFKARHIRNSTASTTQAPRSTNPALLP
jgi:hypothetical protein